MKIDELTMRFNNQLINFSHLYHVIDHCPLTISPDSYIIDAIILMSQEKTHNLSPTDSNSATDSSVCAHQETDCILVVEGKKLLGIFTYKDVIRITANKIDFSQVKMAEVMTQPVITLTQANFHNIYTALSLLHQHQIRHLPIVDEEGQLLGIVTETSLLQAIAGEVAALQQILQDPIDDCRQANQQPEGGRCQTHDHLKQWFTSQSIELVQVNQVQQTLEELQLTERTAELLVSYELLQREIAGRQRTEEALQQSEKLYRQLVESQTDLITRIDLQGRITFANTAACQILGQQFDELLGQHLFEFFHVDDLPQITANITTLLSPPHHLITDEQRLFTVDGVRWFQWNVAAIKNDAGEVVELQGVGRDITERKQMERELQAALDQRQQAESALCESEERYRSVVAAIQEGVVLHEANGNIVACNASAERILGRSTEHILNRNCNDPCWQTIHQDGSPFPGDTHPAMVTLRTGQPCANVVMGVYQPNGQLTWISINSQPLFRANDSLPYAVVTSFADISELQAALCDRQQAEQKIFEQAALLDIATDAILVRDFQSKILFWNQGAERLYGWCAQEVLGKDLQQFLYKKTSPQLKSAFKTVTESGSWQGELHKVTKSGKEIIVESRWTLMHDAAGQPNILSVDTDITQKKQLEEQFFRAQRLESLGTLAGGIAHDLNNILTPILAASQLLQVRLPQDKEHYQHLLAIIESNAKRGAALVKQVLSFARGFKGERTIVQLKHLISEITLIAKQTFPKSIEFAITIPEDLWAVSGDVTQLHQVLMNLVVNARDAMPDGGTIEISAANTFIDEAYTHMNLDAKVGHYIVMTIADTGMGMPPEILDRIFDPFFTTKEIGTGTGLGLSTVLGIIKSHGGFVSVSSKVDQGSKFKLFLPAVEANQVLDTNNLEIRQGKGELILIVDDETQICEIAKIILEKYNYKALTANNGIEAIALYAQHKQQISAVLMDIMMPEMDGITAIRTLQKMNPQVQIIACSGINPNETLVALDHPGVQLVVSKPYTAQELLNSLHHILSKN
jgi:hypothetical protein